MSTVGTPRYQLAKDIFMADNADAPSPEREWDIATTKEHAYAYGIADGLIAAGYRKPRTITSVEELDALPDGAIVLDYYEDVCVLEDSAAAGYRDTHSRTWSQPDGTVNLSVSLPATVLYEPTEATK